MGAPESIFFNFLSGLVSQPLVIALQEAGKREGLFHLHTDGKTEAKNSQNVSKTMY